MVTILDEAGKELKRAEGTETADPAPLVFSPLADGICTVKVVEKFRGRAGANFVYRLRVLDAPEVVEPGFRLAVAADVFTVPRAGSLKVKVTAERFGAFKGPIELKVDGLPKGIEAKPLTLVANQTTADLTITATTDAVIGHSPLSLVGTATVGDKPVSLAAEFVDAGGSSEGQGRTGEGADRQAFRVG